MLPVSGRTVETLRGEPVLAQLVGDVGVVEVGQPLTGLGVGKEEVPEAEFARLGLGSFEQLELAGRPAPAVVAVLAELEELLGDRIDLVADERLHRVVEGPNLLRHPQIEIVRARHLQCATDHVRIPPRDCLSSRP
jgi:hypothetical protein